MHAFLPSLYALLRVAGRGRGWGVLQQTRCKNESANLLRHPPRPTPPHRFAGGGERQNSRHHSRDDLRGGRAIDGMTDYSPRRAVLDYSGLNPRAQHRNRRFNPGRSRIILGRVAARSRLGYQGTDIPRPFTCVYPVCATCRRVCGTDALNAAPGQKGAAL